MYGDKKNLNIAIVGTSKDLSENEDRDIRQQIALILKDYDPYTTTIITGGAKGVDTIASEVALLANFAVKSILPLGIGWKFNKPRNIQIAEECDILFCITVPARSNKSMCYHHNPIQNHEKTAGCWTMNTANIDFGKVCKLIVLKHKI